MTDAERLAHAAGEVDEAAAMRRAGPQPAEDLERVLEAIEDWHSYLTDSRTTGGAEQAAVAAIADLLTEHWPTIRAALDRERKLREALGRMVTACELEDDLEEAYNQAKALLAQPAAGEERERG